MKNETKKQHRRGGGMRARTHTKQLDTRLYPGLHPLSHLCAYTIDQRWGKCTKKCNNKKII